MLCADMKGKSSCVHILKEWLMLSAVSFVIYEVLWTWIDVSDDFFTWVWRYLASDFIYCSLFCACVMTVNHFLYRWLWPQKRFYRYFIAVAGVALLIDLGVAFLFESLIDLYWGNEFALRITEGMYIFTCIAAFLTTQTILHHHYKLLVEQQRLNKQMELELLKRQLDPHFMFNNLSTLAGMVGPDHSEAQHFITTLSRIYRYITTHVTQDVVTIAESMTFIRDYGALLDIRHPGHFKLHIAPGLEDNRGLILSLSLQLLTENAIKHNKHSVADPLVIYYELDDGYLVVKNKMNYNNAPVESARVGLANLKQRYLLLANRPCLVRMTDTDFEVKLPILNPEDYADTHC